MNMANGMRTGRGRSRRLALLAVGVAGATLLLNPFSGSVPAAETPQLQGFHLRVAHSAKDAGVGSAADGAPVVQWTPQTLNNQGWVPLPFGPAWVFVNLNSNKVLDVAGGSTANGAAVIQQGWAGTASQVWFLVNFGTTHKVFVNFNSGKAMDVAGASITDGAPLIQWDWMGSTNQIWSGVPVGMPTSSTTSSTTPTTVTPTTVTPTTVTPTTVTPTTVTPTTL